MNCGPPRPRRKYASPWVCSIACLSSSAALLACVECPGASEQALDQSLACQELDVHCRVAAPLSPLRRCLSMARGRRQVDQHAHQRDGEAGLGLEARIRVVLPLAERFPVERDRAGEIGLERVHTGEAGPRLGTLGPGDAAGNAASSKRRARAGVARLEGVAGGIDASTYALLCAVRRRQLKRLLGVLGRRCRRPARTCQACGLVEHCRHARIDSV